MRHIGKYYILSIYIIKFSLYVINFHLKALSHLPVIEYSLYIIWSSFIFT